MQCCPLTTNFFKIQKQSGWSHLLQETKPNLHANHFLVKVYYLVKPLISKRCLHAAQLLEYSNVVAIQNIPNTQTHCLLEISKILSFWVAYFFLFVLIEMSRKTNIGSICVERTWCLHHLNIMIRCVISEYCFMQGLKDTIPLWLFNNSGVVRQTTCAVTHRWSRGAHVSLVSFWAREAHDSSFSPWSL